MSTLRHFEPDLTPTSAAPRVVQARPVDQVAVETTVTATAHPSTARAYLAKGEDAWTWEDLRDYVVGQIEARFGVFPRDPRKESGIFKSFLARYPQAPAIARYAFEVADGFWMGAPISVNRFCKGSDRYFGDVIAERLVTQPVQGW